MRYYYILGIEQNGIHGETNSRDSKKLVREFGCDEAYVVNKSGRVISAAARDVNENIYNTSYGYGDEAYIGHGYPVQDYWTWGAMVDRYKKGPRRYFGK